MPNALLEAMSAGKAIVATPVGGIPEILAFGQAGLLVDPNINSVVKALSQLIMDRDLCRKYGELAKERIRTQYSIESMLEKLMNLYADVIN